MTASSGLVVLSGLWVCPCPRRPRRLGRRWNPFLAALLVVGFTELRYEKCASAPPAADLPFTQIELIAQKCEYGALSSISVKGRLTQSHDGPLAN